MATRVLRTLNFSVGYIFMDAVLEGAADGTKKPFHHVVATSFAAALPAVATREAVGRAALSGAGLGVLTLPLYYYLFERMKRRSPLQIINEWRTKAAAAAGGAEGSTPSTEASAAAGDKPSDDKDAVVSGDSAAASTTSPPPPPSPTPDGSSSSSNKLQ